MHEDQLPLDRDVVQQLISDQFPQWSLLPVRQIATTATVNAIFRVGEDLVARFPLRAQDTVHAGGWLRSEAAAARELAEVSPVPTPRPVALGRPGRGYPLPWTVYTWLPGHDATTEDPSGSVEFAEDLVALITALRSADTRGRRFVGGGRGGSLADHDEWMELCFRRSEGLLEVGRLRAVWQELRELPRVDADVMCHGDLTPPNVLVAGGRLVGLLDGGGFGPADPALDLVAAWHLLDTAPRTVLEQALGCSDLQWRRGMAWALEQAMGLVWYYRESNPGMSRWGRRTAQRVLADDRG